MIMVKNNLRTFTETIYCSERFAIIRIANCVIVNVYLPCAGSDDRVLIVDDILTECWSWCERYLEIVMSYLLVISMPISANPTLFPPQSMPILPIMP